MPTNLSTEFLLNDMTSKIHHRNGSSANISSCFIRNVVLYQVELTPSISQEDTNFFTTSQIKIEEVFNF